MIHISGPYSFKKLEN
uniref:Uncharacterized protein n=1 Tax=Arundo donax TaxID=35708 RepID=A0A0A9FVR2_ARUDO